MRSTPPAETTTVLGCDLTHLVNLIQDLSKRDLKLKVLTGRGASIDTTTASGNMVFGILAALAEYEQALVSERTRAGLAVPEHGDESAKVPIAALAMGKPDTVISELCQKLGISRQTLNRYVSPAGALRPDGKKLLKKK